MAAWPNGDAVINIGQPPVTHLANTGSAVQLIGLDWGSTAMRAYLIGAGSQVIDQRESATGASTMHQSADFANALRAIAGDWLDAFPDVPVLACGMVGSRHGWCEAPYIRCTANARHLASNIVAVPGHRLLVVPGLVNHSDNQPPDVMRGEETQIVGAMVRCPHLQQGACLIMPGTHSKWATIRDGAINDFGTHMTGELFAVLRQHSVLGRLMPEVTVQAETDSPEAFLRGVQAARQRGETGLTHQLFAVRTLGLMDQIPATQLADYLSGLLIGHELASGLRWRADRDLADVPLVLVGSAPLCQRYARALQLFGIDADLVSDNCAAAGLMHLAGMHQQLTDVIDN